MRGWDTVTTPGFAATFLPRGRAPEPGERFVFRETAATLQRIALTKGEAYYRGEIVEALVAHSSANGGSTTLSDLADFRLEWVTPIRKDFAGYTLHEIQPNGQGIAALMALGMLDKLDLGRLPVDSAESQNLQIEAMKLAFADTYRWVAGARFMTEVSAADLLSDGYLAERVKLIDNKRATDFAHGTPNRGYGFTLDYKHPNVAAGGKRPFHTIIPGFLTREVDGQTRPQMSFGVMGGNMQPHGHLQSLVRMLVHWQQPQAACYAPRWKVASGLSVDFESTMAPELLSDLIAMDIVPRRRPMPTWTTAAGSSSGNCRTRWRMDTSPRAIRAVMGRRQGTEQPCRRFE